METRSPVENDVAMFKIRQHKPARSRVATLIRMALLIAGMAVIFAADTLTDYEIAAAVFYVAIVLVAADFLSTLGVLVVAVGCVALTIVSLPLTHAGLHESGVINCVLSICAIGVTTYLALQRSSALIAEHETRAQLTHLARVNTLGEMAASIAHEINQPLTGIVTSGGACRNWLAGDRPNIAKARQAVERMIGDANRASDVVARVRALSKPAELKAEWIDAEALVSDVLALCRVELDRATVAVVRKSDGGLPLVFADSVQIQQVLLNLILNALEAMNGHAASRRELMIETRWQPDAVMEFTVRDAGPGFDLQNAEKMFDAFYSTKAGGMGIGLAISRSIVEAHGGRIWASSSPGVGAELHFTLPGRMLGAT